MSLHMRRAEMRDGAAIGELATILVGLNDDRRAVFDVLLADSSHDLIVAEVDGEVVGFAHLAAGPSFFLHSAELCALVVRSDRRRQGIGRALMQAVLRSARDRGITELHINTEQENEAAMRLYTRLGAKVVGLHLQVDVK